MTFEDAGNGVKYDMGSLGGYMRLKDSIGGTTFIRFAGTVSLDFNADTSIKFNTNKNDRDIIFYGDLAEIARFDAGTESLDFNDNQQVKFGTGGDSEIHYDTANLIIDPNVVGSGKVLIGATGDDDLVANTLESTVVTGTAPLTIASTTLVTNLNADQVDGKDETAFVLVDGTRTLTANWDAGNFDLTMKSLTMDGDFLLQSATDSTTAFQILDNDGGNPVVNVDTVNERLGVGIALPAAKLDIDYNETTVTAGSYYGMRSDMDSTGIFTTGTADIYGIYGDATASGVSTGGIVNTYGGYFTAVGENTGAATTNAYGLYVNGATGADNNYSAVFMNGNVGIGTTTPGAALHVYDDAVSDYVAEFYNDGNNTNRWGLLVQVGEDTPSGTNTLMQFNDGDGGAVGSITYDNTQTFYNTSSDIRLKDNITDTLVGINDLLQIKIRDFTFKNDPSEEIVHGVIAQEINEVYSQAVSIPEEKNKYWSVDYSKLTPLIVKAVQEQQIQIEETQTNFEGLSLKTDESITTVDELQTSIDEQLAMINTQFKDQDLELTNLEDQINENSSLLAILQEQIDELQILTNQELNLARIGLNEQDISFIKLLLGTDRVANPEDVDILGNLEAAGVVAGAFTVKVGDSEAATIGGATLEEGEIEVVIKTKAVTNNSKVFVVSKTVTDQPLAVTNIEEGKSFTVEVKNPVTENIEFDWWIVEADDSVAGNL
ncbi:hypothetical protein BMS3Abin15_01213 [bacterium BMS3Abin15]|nr:hypothetical protein BMS3Abin15_01213 [bacterium BMS3Abin15]